MVMPDHRGAASTCCHLSCSLLVHPNEAATADMVPKPCGSCNIEQNGHRALPASPLAAHSRTSPPLHTPPSTMALQMKSVAGAGLNLRVSRRSCVRPVASGGGKTDLNKVGLNSIENEVVKSNLMGKSRFMDKKGWVDSQGRKGKGYGVYRFADKYGANVDGYSPIYTPDLWANTGDSYKLGTKGLIAWAGLVLVLLAIGVNLIVSTSQLGA